jgi:transcriptional regulator with XRE-family HTH domain
MPTHFNHEALLAARLDLGLTQEGAANLLRVDERTYRRYESGEVNAPGRDFVVHNTARRRLLFRMAEEFGIPASALTRPVPLGHENEAAITDSERQRSDHVDEGRQSNEAPVTLESHARLSESPAKWLPLAEHLEAFELVTASRQLATRTEAGQACLRVPRIFVLTQFDALEDAVRDAAKRLGLPSEGVRQSIATLAQLNTITHEERACFRALRAARDAISSSDAELLDYVKAWQFVSTAQMLAARLASV